MITYKTMVKEAKAAGLATEKTMWESIDSFSDLLDELKDTHPDMYWRFMREQHGLMHHNHYDESFALYDVAQLRYTNKTGEKMSGAHWAVEQIESATAGMRFPPGTTKWDKYVAFNAMYSDLSKGFEDGDILKAGHLFYFADEDWGTDTKIWEYMSKRPKK